MTIKKRFIIKLTEDEAVNLKDKLMPVILYRYETEIYALFIAFLIELYEHPDNININYLSEEDPI